MNEKEMHVFMKNLKLGDQVDITIRCTVVELRIDKEGDDKIKSGDTNGIYTEMTLYSPTFEKPLFMDVFDCKKREDESESTIINMNKIE